MNADDAAEVDALLRRLAARVSELEQRLDNRLRETLTKRGLRVLRADPIDRLLLPAAASPSYEQQFYALMKRYSFRLVLRDLIRDRESFQVSDLLNYASEDSVRDYLDFLLEHGVIDRKHADAYRLALPHVDSFGDTLEWFVAQVLVREFSCPALWGVKLEGMETGGDYDVLARVEDRLVHVEVKSSPPKHIEEKEVAAFIDRTAALRPDVAIFLEDTGLRMKDKIVVLFREALERRNRTQGGRTHAVTRLRDEIFLVGDRVFIVNSAPDIVQNLGFCLAHMLRPTPPL